MLSETFKKDRTLIEGKYHDPARPFNPFARMAYHGWECPEDSGLPIDSIKAGLEEVAAKYAGESHEVRKARAVEYVLAHTRIDVRECDYFPLVYTWNREIKAMTVEKWCGELFGEKVAKDVAETYALFNQSGSATIWPDFDHVIPDWDSIMSLGFPGLLERARAYRAKHEVAAPLSAAQRAYFDGIEIEYAAIVRFLGRLADAAETKPHAKAAVTAASLRRLASGAPKTFFDALMIIYLYFMISESIDVYQVRSLGNGLDSTLRPFYERDLSDGVATRGEIREFLAYFLMQWSAIGNYWGQPFYMGGTDAAGRTKVNPLSYDILDVYVELGIFNPKIQLKYGPSVPRDFLDKFLACVREARGNFVFCCEKGMVKAVMSYGASLEEAREYDIRGCYETGVRANEVSASGAYVNALKPVEYVFSNGYDRRISKQVGPKTGELSSFATFNDFYKAYLDQWGYVIDRSMDVVRGYEGWLGWVNPSSLYSATIVHSLERATDGYQSGVKFNNSAQLNCGFASAVDSLMVVKTLVYDEKSATLEEFKAALDANWEGHETLRRKVLACRCRYGNGNEVADLYAGALAKFFALKVGNKPNARGGVFKPIMHSARQYIDQGAKTLATPDGRKAGEEASKNASPSIGMDREGVTALIASALKLDPPSYNESFCLDVMLHPAAVAGEAGLGVMKALLDVYEQGNGQSIQFNVFDPALLRDAQENPERYQNLQVRICGWNAKWVSLVRAEQDAYIARADAAAKR